MRNQSKEIKIRHIFGFVLILPIVVMGFVTLIFGGNAFDDGQWLVGVTMGIFGLACYAEG